LTGRAFYPAPSSFLRASSGLACHWCLWASSAFQEPHRGTIWGKMATMRAALLPLTALLVSSGSSLVPAQTKEPPSCVIGDRALAQGQPQLALEEYEKCL